MCDVPCRAIYLFVIQVSLRKWERFETNKETVVRYLFQTGSSHERFLSFSSLESLSSELEQTKVYQGHMVPCSPPSQLVLHIYPILTIHWWPSLFCTRWNKNVRRIYTLRTKTFMKVGRYESPDRYVYKWRDQYWRLTWVRQREAGFGARRWTDRQSWIEECPQVGKELERWLSFVVRDGRALTWKGGQCFNNETPSVTENWAIWDFLRRSHSHRCASGEGTSKQT